MSSRRENDRELEEQFFALLADYDEQVVRASDSPASARPKEIPEQLLQRLDRAKAILDRLQRAARDNRDGIGSSTEQPDERPSDPSDQYRAALAALGDAQTGDDAAADHKEWDRPRSTSRVTPPLPERIGRFHLLEELGQGGFGIVLRAYDPNLRRDVALKIPRLGCLADGRERFLREAWASAGLDHPNIVPVYEAGEDGLFCYIASALCSGPDLAQWLKHRDEPVPVDDAVQIVQRLADAVQHAHASGVLHRDLKPANVLLDATCGSSPTKEERAESSHRPDQEFDQATDITVKVTDFGLAKLQDEQSQLTGTSLIVGTAAYMAPEQAIGVNSAQPAADIYALGAIFYELLTGRPPFQGENDLDTLQHVRNRDPIAPRQLRPRLPRDVETICLKCLEKEPTRRYGSAAELRDDLQRYLRGRPIVARPIRAPARLWRWCCRNRALAALSACLVVSLLLMVVGSIVGSLRLLDEIRQSKRNLIDAYVAQANAGRRSKLAGQRIDSLASLRQAVQLSEEVAVDGRVTQQLVDEAIACTKLVDLGLDNSLKSPATPLKPQQVSFDRKARRYAHLEPNGRISVRAFKDNHLVAELQQDNLRFDLLCLSPDGQCTAARGERGDQAVMQVWRNSVLIAELPGKVARRVVHLAFSPDGSLLAAAGRNRTVSVYDPASLAQRVKFHVSFQPRGSRFDGGTNRLAIWGGSLVVIVNVTDGSTIRTLRHPGNDQVQDVAWSPDGRYLAIGGSHHIGYAWHLASGTPPLELPGHQAWVKHVAFSQCGDLLATSSTDGTTRLWEYWTGEHLLTARGNGMQFADGDRWLVGLQGSSLARWRVFSGRECTTLRTSDPHYEALSGCFSPDGRFLACSSYYGFALWDWSQKEEIRQVDLHDPHEITVTSNSQGVFVITCSDKGAFRTRIRFEDQTREFRVDSPQRIQLPESLDCPLTLDVSRDGRILALTGHGKTCVVDLTESEPAGVHISDPQARGVAVSCDGQFAATFGAHGAQLWHVSTGQSAGKLPIQEQVLTAAFSPDGRWLITDTAESLIFWRTGIWAPTHRIAWGPAEPDVGLAAANWSSYASFSADGRVLAVSRPGYAIKLISPTGFRLLGTLPVSFPNAWVSVSPDGTQLACANAELTVEVWDLKLVHHELASLGLAW